jgi:AhpD family alkylhydroperoxidase
MKLLKIFALTGVVAFFTANVLADEVPAFYKNTYPEFALKSRLEAESVLMGEHAKLDAKTRELIALGVSAQIPCVYCVYVHTKNAREAGATETEIREAVATAAHVRHWSTVLNGMAYDLDTFKAEVDKMHGAK